MRFTPLTKPFEDKLGALAEEQAKITGTADGENIEVNHVARAK